MSNEEWQSLVFLNGNANLGKNVREGIFKNSPFSRYANKTVSPIQLSTLHNCVPAITSGTHSSCFLFVSILSSALAVLTFLHYSECISLSPVNKIVVQQPCSKLYENYIC